MLLDQGVGAHHAQVEYAAVGAWWTAVSQELDVPDPPSMNKIFSITRTINLEFETR